MGSRLGARAGGVAMYTCLVIRESSIIPISHRARGGTDFVCLGITACVIERIDELMSCMHYFEVSVM